MPSEEKAPRHGVNRAWLAGVFLALGGAYLERALSYGLGTLRDPGIGFFPAIVAIVWAAAAASMLWQLPNRGPAAVAEDGSPADGRGPLARAGLVAVGVVAFIVLSPVVGFAGPAMLLAILCLVGGGERRILLVAVVTGTAATLCYAVLIGLMGLPMSSLF